MALFTPKYWQLDYNDYKTGSTFDVDKMRKDARKLAKRANQRLRDLEKAGLTSSPAYRGAQKALSGYYDRSGAVSFGSNKNGRPRYRERLQTMTEQQLKSMLYALDKTLNARTSTVSGTKFYFSEGLTNIKQMAEDSDTLSMNDMLDILRDSAIQKAEKLYGYKAVIQIFDSLGAEGLSPAEVKQRLSDVLSGIDPITGTSQKVPVNLTELFKSLNVKAEPYQLTDEWYDI